MRHRQAHGQRMTSVKTIPFGQMLDPNDPSKTIPCPAEIDAIKEAQQLCVTGLSLRKIAKRIGPIRGKILSAQSVKSLLTRRSAG